MKAITIYPALKLMIAIIFGIAMCFAGKYSIHSTAFLVFSIIFIVIGIHRLSRNYSYWLSAIFLGMWIGQRSNEIEIHSQRKIIPRMDATIKGEIVSIVQKDSLYAIYIIKGWIDTKQLPRMESCRILLTIGEAKQSKNLSVGSIIWSTANVSLPEPTLLPGLFNQAAYCKALDIQFCAFAKSKNTVILERKNTFYSYAYSSSQYIQSIIDSIYPKSTEHIVIGLLLGETKGISQEIKKAYTMAGTAHILSVSGFHTGIIAFGLTLVLGFINTGWIRLTVFTVCLSIFLLITGMDPPAIRAGIMSFISMSIQLSGRKQYPINILSAVIIVMLISDPSLLYSAGFFMSICAMIGLLIFSPLIKKQFIALGLQKMLPQWLIDSISVSFSASIIMAPIIGFYFETISLISPIANIFLLPGISLAMIWSIFAIVLYPINHGISLLYVLPSHYALNTINSIHLWIAECSWIEFRSHYAWIYGIAICSISIYICNCKNKTVFFLRIISSIIVFWGIHSFIQIQEIQDKDKISHTISLYSGRKTIGLFTQSSSNQQITFLLFDRKAHQYSTADNTILNFMHKNSPKKISLYLAGRCSIMTAKSIQKKERNSSLVYKEVKPTVFYKYVGLLIKNTNKAKHFVQIIDIPDY
jgi:competence protein ComEC